MMRIEYIVISILIMLVIIAALMMLLGKAIPGWEQLLSILRGK
jgi:Flp pilus assembly pilin Flp